MSEQFLGSLKTSETCSSKELLNKAPGHIIPGLTGQKPFSIAQSSEISLSGFELSCPSELRPDCELQSEPHIDLMNAVSVTIESRVCLDTSLVQYSAPEI